MTTFRFRFATLKQLRISHRAQRQGELSKAIEALEILEGQETDLLTQTAEAVDSSRAVVQPGNLNVDSVLGLQRHRMLLKGLIDQLRLRMKDVKAEIERRRELLVEADRQVRVLEKLEEKLAAAHATEQLAIEQKLMDELATLRGVRGEEAWT